MNGFVHRPVFFHALMTAIGLFAVKFSFYLFHHWEYNLSPVFLFSSWLFIMLSMALACQAEKKVSEVFGYWRAFVVCAIVAGMGLTGAMLAEQILYRLVDTGLGDQMKQADMSMTLEMLEKNTMLNEADRNKLLAVKSKTRPEDYYNVTYMLSFFVAKFIGNMIFAFLLAALMRKKPNQSGSTVV